jgi:hypothetical protein
MRAEVRSNVLFDDVLAHRNTLRSIVPGSMNAPLADRAWTTTQLRGVG